jgi:hypothetical protein
MKRNIILLILLLGLCALAWWAYQRNAGGTTLSSYEGTFAIPDTNMIDKVSMVDRNGKKLTVERKEGYWLVNDKYPAEPVIVTELLRTLSLLEIKFIPPKSMISNILKSLGTHGRRVDIWDRKGQLLKTYYVGGVTPDGMGTFFLMEGSDQPFVVTMKYFVGSVSVRYHLDEKDWRDLSLLPLAGKEVVRFSMEYPRQREKSFSLEKEKDQWKVDPYYELSPRNPGRVDQDMVETYLRDIRKLKIEGFMNENPQKDSIARMLPFCTIRLTTDAGEDLALSLHPLTPTDRKGNILVMEDGTPSPILRYQVSTNWGDFMQVQNEPISRLFASYDLFFR